MVQRAVMLLLLPPTPSPLGPTFALAQSGKGRGSTRPGALLLTLEACAPRESAPRGMRVSNGP
jgi:hypothetical protein